MNWSESIIKLHIYTFSWKLIFFFFNCFFVFLFFLTVFNTQCCFIVVRFSPPGQKPDCAQMDPGVREALQKLTIFMSSENLFFSLRTRVVGHLSNLPYNVLRKEQQMCSLSCWCVKYSSNQVCRDDKEYVIPVANLFLLRESLYPVPCSSISTPDRVLPSFINCTARVEGFDGPFESSNLALRDPAPGGQTQTNTITCQQLIQLSFRHTPSPHLEQAISNCKQRRKGWFTFVFRLFWDVTQLPQTFILLWIPKIRERNSTSSPFCLNMIERFSACHTPCSPAEITSAISYQMELGSDCMLVTPPSTGTKICTLVSGPGLAMESGLYR